MILLHPAAAISSGCLSRLAPPLDAQRLRPYSEGAASSLLSSFGEPSSPRPPRQLERGSPPCPRRGGEGKKGEKGRRKRAAAERTDSANETEKEEKSEREEEKQPQLFVSMWALPVWEAVGTPDHSWPAGKSQSR